jgi:hypothetical protein
VPVGGQRDPEETKAALIGWLGHQMPGAHEIAIENLVVPQSSGFSNETFLFDAGRRRRTARTYGASSRSGVSASTSSIHHSAT